MKRILFGFLLFAAACSPVPPSSPSVDAFATASTVPYLSDLYACADAASVTLNITPFAPQIQIRLGELDGWNGAAYQIGTEDVLVAASAQSPLPILTSERARELFAGRGDPSVQVWAYASSVDAQRAFESALMDGRSVASLARLAVSPSQMVQALTSDARAVGILPRRWMTEGLRELYLAAAVPVLALTPSEPAGAVRELVACMQKRFSSP